MNKREFGDLVGLIFACVCSLALGVTIAFFLLKYEDKITIPKPAVSVEDETLLKEMKVNTSNSAVLLKETRELTSSERNKKNKGVETNGYAVTTKIGKIKFK